VLDPARKGLIKTKLQLGTKVAVIVAKGGYLHWVEMGGVPGDLG
jgi:hypothetical protein